MLDTRKDQTNPVILTSPAVAGDITQLYLFSSTLLSTMQLNKLLHLILSALVCKQNGLFQRSMLLLFNQKTATLQGMLGICRSHTQGFQVVAAEPDNPLSGYWDLDAEAMAAQLQSELCGEVRGTRIDLAEGCQLIASVVQDRQLYRFDESDCLNCDECEFFCRFGITACAAVPLVTRNNLIGVIIVDNPVDRQRISDEQLQVLQLFANQAGMAIENTRLYRNLEEAHAELTDARQRLVHGAHLAAIGEMAASISHELKTPLITIGGFAARLSRMVPEDSPQRHYLDTILNESHRLERLLGDILAFSRKPTICYQPCCLQHVLQECLSDYSMILADRGIRLESDIESGEWLVLGDSSQLKQVFLNLLVNAQEAMPDGGWLRVTLGGTEEQGQSLAVVTIADSGGGVPEEAFNRLFTPFFTTKRHGTGLGLAIVNRIVQNHGGRLRASNTADGAEFRILLPLAAAELLTEHES